MQRSGVRAPLRSNRVVSLSKACLLPKSTGIHRRRWLRLNMTEKLFTRTLRINQPTISSSSLKLGVEDNSELINIFTRGLGYKGS